MQRIHAPPAHASGRIIRAIATGVTSRVIVGTQVAGATVAVAMMAVAWWREAAARAMVMFTAMVAVAGPWPRRTAVARGSGQQPCLKAWVLAMASCRGLWLVARGILQ